MLVSYYVNLMSSYMFNYFPIPDIGNSSCNILFLGGLSQHKVPTSPSAISESSDGPQQAEAKLHLW